ncbi:MAG TPA: outer membrane beta-barrel protein, partial [Hyphomicrobiaceae bacterium]
MASARLLLGLTFGLLCLTVAGDRVHAQARPDGIGGRPWATPIPQRQAARSTAIQADSSAESAEADDSPLPPVIRSTLVDDDRPAALFLPIDGIVTEADVDQIETGSTEADTRSRSDIDTFDRPRAGFDPDAFSIEPEPALDRRPERRFRRDPFDPTGIRMGSFMIFPEAELAAAAYSNIFRAIRDPLGDAALEFRPSVRAVSMWSRHALEFRAEGNTSFHNSYSSEDDRGTLLEVRGRLDFTRRTSIEALAG